MRHQLSARREAFRMLKDILLGMKGIVLPPKKVKPEWCKCPACGGWHYSAK